MSVHFKTIVTTALLALAATAVHAQDIKIGYNADQSASGVAELGTAGRWGFEAAIEDINKAGGILGRVKEIFAVIRSLKSYGVTIPLIEQMANQALAVAERAYVLETGRITIQGSGAELRRDPRIRAAYLGEH